MVAVKQERVSILYAEGYRDSAEAFSILLQEWGYDVVTASRLDESLESARCGRFDLYLIAGILADARGLDLCRKIREFDRITPVVFFSALAFKSDKEAAIEAGAQAYLVKPCEPESLLETLRRLTKCDANSNEEPDRPKSLTEGGYC